MAPLKAKLREFQNKLRDEVRVEAIRIHKAIGTRSLTKYEKAWYDREWSAEAASIDWRYAGRRDERKELVNRIAGQVIAEMLSRAKKGSIAPQQPTVADLDRVIPKATNKTTRFPVFARDGYSEAEISFNGRVVRWYVGENNHAVDAAREAPLAVLFFAHLNRIQWTRGTGGVGLYHSEYQDDYASADSYARSISFAYGPIGEAAEARRMGVSVEKYRSIQRESRRVTTTVRYGVRRY